MKNIFVLLVFVACAVVSVVSYNDSPRPILNPLPLGVPGNAAKVGRQIFKSWYNMYEGNGGLWEGPEDPEIVAIQADLPPGEEIDLELYS